MPRAELAFSLPADKRPKEASNRQACNTLGKDAVEDNLAKLCADIGDAHESNTLQQTKYFCSDSFLNQGPQEAEVAEAI